MAKNTRESVREALRAEVVEMLGLYCVAHPSTIIKIAKMSGVSRPTIQRLFDHDPVCLETLYKLKKWLNEVEKKELEL